MTQQHRIIFSSALVGITGIGFGLCKHDRWAQADPPVGRRSGPTFTVSASPDAGARQRKMSVVPLSGTADLPRWFKPGGTVSYILRSAGQFITPVGGKPVNLDVTTQARPVMLRSIQPGSLQVRTALLPNGERVYHVTGTARREPGVYMDTWMTYNTPRDTTKLAAIPQLFVQNVFIRAEPVPIAGGESSPPLPTKLDWQEYPANLMALARAIHPAPRDSAAARLLPKLTARLSAGQRRELDAGKETSIPVSSLPAALQHEAIAYIALACQGMGGRNLIQYDSRQPPPYDKFSLVILPGRDHLLGINGVPHIEGMQDHF